MREEFFTIQKAAEWLGVSPTTLRRWEEKGVLIPERTVGNQRRYSLNALQAFKSASKHENQSTFQAQNSTLNNTPIHSAPIPGENMRPIISSLAAPILSPTQGSVQTPVAPDAESPVHAVPQMPIPQAAEKAAYGEKITAKQYGFRAPPATLTGLFVGIAVLLFASYSSLSSNFAPTEMPAQQTAQSENAVLATTTKGRNLVGDVLFNVPAIFENKVTMNDKFEVNGESLFTEDITVADKNVDLGTGELTASNVVYGLTAGANITITGDPQNPTISAGLTGGVDSIQGQSGDLTLTTGSGIGLSGLQITNTGVLSVGGQTGTVSLAGGSGISVSGTTITNTDTGSAQNIFKTIIVGSDSFAAGSNTDSLTFAAGTGITITPDTTNKKLTITGTGSSGWSDGGTLLSLSDNTDNISIGSSTEYAKLGIIGDTDEIQLVVRGHSSQTANLIVAENSSGTDLFVVGSTGQIVSGSSNITLTTAAGYLDADAISLISSDGAGNNSSASGLETDTDRLGLLQGCANGQVLKWNDSSTLWECSNDSGAAASVVNIENNDLAIGTDVDTIDFTTDFSVSASPSNEVNIAIADDVINFTELADSLTIDAATGIALGNNNLTLGTSAGVGGVIIAPNAGGNAGLIVNKQSTSGDIFSASASGTTRFTITNAGNVQFSGNTSFVNTITSAATNNQTYTLPDATGTICLSTGNCAGAGTSITGSGTTTQIAFFSGGAQNLASDADLYWDNTNKLIGIGTSSPLAKMHVTGAATGKALTILNETGDQDILSASASGTTAFTVGRNGNLTLSSTTATSDRLVFAPQSGGAGTFTGTVTSVDLTGNWTYTLPNETGTFCLTSGNCAGVGGNGDITAVGSMGSGDAFSDNTADDDWLGLGASAGRLEFDDQTVDEINILSAKLGVGTATPQGLFEVTGASTGQALVILNETGNQNILVGSASGTTRFAFDRSGNLSLSGGAYQIDGTSVLNGTTLGGNVINSSLQTVGTIGTGTWQASAVGAAYGGTGDNTSGVTGVPYISSGNWLYESELDETRGGTGLSAYVAGDMLYGSGVNTLSRLTIGSDGQILTVSGGVPDWTDPGGTLNYWQRANGALAPFNVSDDLLLGATSTASAKFGFLNVAGGTPTASISASANNALYFTGDGTIATTNKQSLTLGTSSTGNIIFNGGNVGIGTATPLEKFSVVGNASISGTLKVDDIITKGPSVDVRAYGAACDGTTNDRAAFERVFSMYPNSRIIVPGGSCVINNSTGYLTATNFNGELIFNGQSKLLFTDNTKGGISFNGGTNAKISNIRTEYQSTPGTRTDLHAIFVESATNITFDGVYIDGAPGAGLLFYIANRPKVTNAHIINTMADGLHFSNTQDGQVNNLTTINTGDDGLAFVNYSEFTNNTGGNATNINIKTSKARGISVIGQSNVTVSNFLIDGTASSGVLVAYESGYNTRVPNNVKVGQGTILNAGTVTPLVGNQYGIEYNSVLSVDFSDIAASESASRGLSGAASAGKVTLRDIRVTNNHAGSGMEIAGQTVDAEGLTSENSPGYGVTFINSTSVVAKDITAINAYTAGGLNRAIWFEGNTNITADGLHVIDTQGSATGYIVGEASNTSGTVANIQHRITNGTFSITNGSAGVRFVGINANHYAGMSIGSSYYNTTAPTNGLLVEGNVGIGTTLPTAALDVAGAASFSGALTFRAGAGALQTTANNTLTLGGTTTGDINFKPGNSLTSLYLASNGFVGLGTTTPLASLDVRSSVGTLSIASVSGASTFAGFTVDNTGLGDIFTASKSGATKFSILNNGNLQIYGTQTAPITLTSNATAARSIALPDASGTVCLQGSASCGFSVGTNFWQSASAGTISPYNNTVDLLVGGTSTASAKFAITNMASGTPIASISGTSNNAFSFNATGVLSTTNAQTLQLGAAGTGNVVLAPNGSTALTAYSNGNVTVAGDLNVTGNDISLNGNLRISDSINSQYTNLRPQNGTLTIYDATNNQLVNIYGPNGDSALQLSSTNNEAQITSTASNLALYMQNNGGTVGINNTSFNNLAQLDVRGFSNTLPIASFSGSTTNAGLLVDNNGTGDLFTASKSGATKFTISRDGYLALAGAAIDNTAYINAPNFGAYTNGDVYGSSLNNFSTFNNASVEVNTTGTRILRNIGDSNVALIVEQQNAGSTGDILQLKNNAATLLSLSQAGVLNLGTAGYANCGTLSTVANVVTCASSTGTNYWQSVSAGTIAPYNTTVDLLVGGTATTSAKFAITGVASNAPVATLSGSTGGTYLSATGTLQTTLNQTLSLGGSSTGNILLNSDGNNRVGIGMTSPGSALSVSGDIRTYDTGGDLTDYTALQHDGTNGAVAVNSGNLLFNVAGNRIDFANDDVSQYITLGVDDDLVWNYEDTMTNLYRDAQGTLQTNATLNILGGANSGGKAALIVNQTGSSNNDIFTASSSGTSRFTITNAGGIKLGTNEGDAGNCLISGGAGAAVAWTSCAGGINYWNMTNGLLYNGNLTTDIALGGISSASAKFLVSPSGTRPTASVSANTASAGLIVDNTGSGDLFTASKSGATKFVITNAGNVGINTATPDSALNVIGFAENVATFASSIGGGNDTTITLGGTTARTGEQYITYRNSDTGANAWMAGMDDDEKFKWYYGTAGEVASNFMTLQQNGYLGLGTSIPGNMIQAIGNIDAYDGGTQGSLLTNTGSMELAQTANGAFIDFKTTVGEDYDARIEAYGGGLALRTGGSATQRHLFDTNGLVGFNTVNPLATMDVQGASGTLPIASLSGQTSNATLIVDNRGSGDIFTASSSGLNRFVVKQNGNIGIGVNSPSQAMEFADGKILQLSSGQIQDYGDLAFKIDADSNSSSVFKFLNGAGTQMMSLNESGQLGLNTGFNTLLSTMDIRTSSATLSVASFSGSTNFATLVADNSGRGDIFAASSSGLNRFVISQNGNVGIGTTAPTDLLHLNGKIRFVSPLEDTVSGNIKIFAGSQPETAADGGLDASSLTTIANYGGDTDPYTGLLFQAGGTSDGGGMKLTDDGLLIWGAGDDNLFKVIDEDSNSTVFLIHDDGHTDVNSNYLEIDTDTEDNERLCHSGADGSGVDDIILRDCTVSGEDFAEFALVKDAGAEPGDVVTTVGPDSANPTLITKTRTTKQYQMHSGVISTNPFIDVLGDDQYKGEEGAKPIALAGRVPVKVSTENGPIAVGDPLAASSVTGVAMKATRAAYVIGFAQEAYDGSVRVSESVLDQEAIFNSDLDDRKAYNSDPNTWPAGVGKIIAEYKPTWIDPHVSLNDDGNVTINGLALTTATLDAAFADVKAHTDDTVALLESAVEEKFTALTQKSNTLEDRVASAEAKLAMLDEAVIIRSTEDGIIFEDKLASSAAIATLTTRDASQSSQLTSLFSQFASLSNRLAFLENNASMSAHNSGLMTLSGFEEFNASSGAELGLDKLDVKDLSVSNNVTVLGRTLLSDLGITGNITAGLLSITGLDDEGEAAINTTAGPLKLQSTGINGIDILNGKVTVSTSGNIMTEGTITTKKVNIDTTDVAGASLGEAILKAGTSSVVIDTTAVTAKSAVFITPKTKTSLPLSVTAQTGGDSFKVETTAISPVDVRFNWWIVN